MPSGIWQALEAGSVRFDPRKNLLPGLRAPDHHHWHWIPRHRVCNAKNCSRNGAVSCRRRCARSSRPLGAGIYEAGDGTLELEWLRWGFLGNLRNRAGSFFHEMIGTGHGLASRAEQAAEASTAVFKGPSFGKRPRKQ
jgi:hypothetical protein